MNTNDIKDTLFREAVEAMDSGNITALEELIKTHPHLMNDRLITNEEGYFKNPYLLWFVANNPIRHEKLPGNITEITRLLINETKKLNPEDLQHRLNYTLGLVATGRIPRECGVQIELMNILIEGGATVQGDVHGMLAHGNKEAAAWLLSKGATLTLAAAMALEMKPETEKLIRTAGKTELQIALMTMAFYGDVAGLKLLLHQGADPNAYIDSTSGFHHHASPLHQAVCSQSLEAVKVLLEAGANTGATDRIYDGTPLGWAHHALTGEDTDAESKKNYTVIVEYLQQYINHKK